MTRIAPIDAATCDSLFESQATSHAGEPIGHHGVLPVTNAVWQDYYTCCTPGIDQPWWATRHTTIDSFDGIIFIDPSLPVFAGHFPGNPILPGIVQIDWAVSTAQEAFEQTPANRFSGMSQIKFKAPVAPASWLRLSLTRAGASVSFTYGNGAMTCTQGRLQYDG